MDWPSEDAGASATVFIRGLPYSWTDLDLSAHFEHIGPVRRSFIINQKRTNTSKGFGFVQFALHDDAQRAVQEMEGKEVGEGRRLRVELAVERGRVGAGKGKGASVGEKRKEQTKLDAAAAKRQKVDEATAGREVQAMPVKAEEEGEDAAKPINREEEDADSETSEDEDEAEEAKQQNAAKERSTRKAHGSVTNGVGQTKQEEQASDDADESAMTDEPTAAQPSTSSGASHSLLVSGIPPSTATLEAMLTQHSLHPTLIVYPAPESTLRKRAARLTFPSASLAARAASILSSVTLPAASAPLRSVALPVNASRLIVRNLPFHIGETQLRKLLSPYGAIASLLVPVKQQSATVLNRGFGFVCYTRMEDAAAMMAAVNGKLQWGRRLAVDWSLDKQQYDARVEMVKKKEQMKDSRKEKRKAAKAAGEEGEAEEEEEEGGELRVKKEEEGDGEASDEDDDVDMVKEEGEEEGMDEGQSDDGESEQDDSESDEQGDDEKSSDDEAAPLSPASSTASSSSSSTSPRAKPSRPAPSSDSDADCTLFIRNLAYETSEQALFDKFSLLGKVKYARIVMERVDAAALGSTKHTKAVEDEESMRQRSKGVAFVRFYNKADADRVVALCQTTGGATGANSGSDRRSMPSMVALSESGITLDGRQLNVVRAVDKRQASQFSAATSQKQDKRNLYLAREGVILPSSAGAAAVLSEEELRKRERYYREKKKKLDNPNFMVSRVRLSMRNLPLDCDDKQLKRTLMAAVKVGRREERAKEREEARRAREADGAKAEDEEKRKRRHEAAMAREAIRRAPIVLRQIKVVRDAERAGAGGLGRSKRYGFAEFTQHETALTALRAINAHSELWKEAGGVTGVAGGRVMVEFAVDDVRKVKERDDRQRRLEKMRDIKAKIVADKAKAAADAAKAEEAGEAAGEAAPMTAKDRKRHAREAGVCYKCGEAGHQAKRCRNKKAATKVEGQHDDGAEAVKDEAMKVEAPANGHSAKEERSKARSGKADKPAANGHAATANSKKRSSEAGQQLTAVRKSGRKAAVSDTEPTTAVSEPATNTGAGKRKREDKPQQQLSKREKRELAGEAKFEAMVSAYKAKFLDAEQPIASKDGGGPSTKGAPAKAPPKSRWFDIVAD